MIIIGLLGAKGAGKSTVASIVKEFFSAKEFAFADHLKNVCSRVFSIPRDVFDHPHKKEKEMDNIIFLNKENIQDICNAFDIQGLQLSDIRMHVGKLLFTPRQVAQYIGTDILRALDADVHCKKVLNMRCEQDFMLISDVRFPNELSAIQTVGGRIVYVQSNAAESHISANSHESERYVKHLAQKCDYRIDNNSDLPELRKVTINMFQQFLVR